jgi:alkanesulfonate monooxygenase SsuD/methylene tetrahydromethanopterin reductase-like flavin-dependent oxidoreductase (luciferase family)
MGERMKLLEDQLQLIDAHWSEDGPAQPKPLQRPRPNLILGGRGGPRSVRMAARYADEYNTVNKTAEECAAIRSALDDECAAAGRDPIPLSLMTTWLAGEDEAELGERANALAAWQGRDGDGEAVLGELRASAIAGTIDENLERLHLVHRDLDAVEQIGRRVAPAVA